MSITLLTFSHTVIKQYVFTIFCQLLRKPVSVVCQLDDRINVNIMKIKKNEEIYQKHNGNLSPFTIYLHTPSASRRSV